MGVLIGLTAVAAVVWFAYLAALLWLYETEQNGLWDAELHPPGSWKP